MTDEELNAIISVFIDKSFELIDLMQNIHTKEMDLVIDKFNYIVIEVLREIRSYKDNK